MPELPEVEVLVRHLAPLVRGKTVEDVIVRRQRVLRPTSVRTFKRKLCGARVLDLNRRGKYLLFSLRAKQRAQPFALLGHLGMTGRMYLAPATAAWPKHAAVIFRLPREQFIFEDTRYFGRLTLDLEAVEKLGPEPLGREFTAASFAKTLSRSTQPIKVKLLDQSVVAGLGNIYASEALFRAGISPLIPAREIPTKKIDALREAIRTVLLEAIEGGSTVPLNYSGADKRDGLFYFGRAAGAADFFEERLQVYDRANQPCFRCRQPIIRLVQAARSTYYCPNCQR